jgi:HNH endonuclease/EVE domain
MSKNYWFHSFKNAAWQEFHEQELYEREVPVTGFPNSRRKRVERDMQIGDYLLCYFVGKSSKKSCWIGALEVVSAPFYLRDEEPLSEKDKIWHDVEFRSRVAVKILISLSPETGVPMSQVRDRLSIFHGSNPKSWPGYLRDNPRKWKGADGKVILAALEERYNTIIAENAVQDVLSLRLEDGDEDIITGYEGGKKLILVNHYERDPALRAEAIRIHGTTCKTCGFDFARVYGSHGDGYIEVHHLRPISSLAEKTPVNPKEDMTVLCSNCHRMIHHRIDNILTLEQLIALIQNRSGNKGN